MAYRRSAVPASFAGVIDTLWTTYDGLGNLLAAHAPSGDSVTYIIDGANRRVGRKVNGSARTSWLYTDEMFVAAELDNTGAVRNRYVYGTSAHVPDLLVQGGTTYRVIADQLGSVRAVVNVTTGAVVQRIDYDAWGNMTTDTAPTFQSLGYAGGLADRATGLVRFGARDYEPATGRWTAKDPIGFGGGSSSVYAYASDQPTWLNDPNGLGGFRWRPVRSPIGGGPLRKPHGWRLEGSHADKCDCEPWLHEAYFYDNETNVGFYTDDNNPLGGKGRVGPDPHPETLPWYTPEPGYYDDETMKRAEANVKAQWNASRFWIVGHNCQMFADALRREYSRLMDGEKGNH